MRKMAVLGASALLVAGLVVSPTVAFAAPVLTGSGQHLPEAKVCADYDSKKQETTGDPMQVTVTAPEGKLISGYCVKAGSVKQGAGEGGVYFVELDEPAASVVITYPWGDGRDISHYALEYIDAVTEPSPEPTVPAEPTPEPTVPAEPTPEPTVPAEEPTTPAEEPVDDEASAEPTEPAAAPVEGGAEPADNSAAPAGTGDTTPSASAAESAVLAATGASTAIGFALIALALVGGGMTLMVLRRKGALGG